MVNGVLMIVAAVLFAVIAIGKELDMLWLCIAGVYLLVGIADLVIYAVKNSRKQKAAEKKLAEQKAAEQKAAEQKAAETAPLQEV